MVSLVVDFKLFFLLLVFSLLLLLVSCSFILDCYLFCLSWVFPHFVDCLIVSSLPLLINLHLIVVLPLRRNLYEIMNFMLIEIQMIWSTPIIITHAHCDQENHDGGQHNWPEPVRLCGRGVGAAYCYQGSLEPHEPGIWLWIFISNEFRTKRELGEIFIIK